MSSINLKSGGSSANLKSGLGGSSNNLKSAGSGNNLRFEQHVLIGVDEAHADSLEAIQGGLSFLHNKHTAKATLFSVVGKAAGTEADLKKRLEKIYKDITDQYSRVHPADEPIAFHAISPFGSDSVATAMVKEANAMKATLIAIGAGKTTSGALGSVANEIVLRSNQAHVLICKRFSGATARFESGKTRSFLIAIDGSIASRVGLFELLGNLCNKGDTVRAVTVSDNSKDISIVEAEVAVHAQLISEKQINVACSHVIRRNKTAAEVLCDLAAESAASPEGLHALVVGSSNGSSVELGSCTKWCVNKCPTSILVMKVSVTA